MSEKFECELCKREFQDRSTYWRHIRRKNACISNEKCVDFLSKLKWYEVKAEKQKEELEEKNQELDLLRTVLKKVQTNDSMRDIFDSGIEDIKKVIERNRFLKQCNQIMNNQQSNLNFKIDMLPPTHERLDHITQDALLYILDRPQFSDSIANLIGNIYFHPKAPENWIWGVVDRNAKYGSLEYNFDTKKIEKRCTKDLIRKTVQNVAFSIGDLLNEVSDNCDLNKVQFVNMNRIFGLVGIKDIGEENIKAIKNMAYENRFYFRGLWKQLGFQDSSTDSESIESEQIEMTK